MTLKDAATSTLVTISRTTSMKIPDPHARPMSLSRRHLLVSLCAVAGSIGCAARSPATTASVSPSPSSEDAPRASGEAATPSVPPKDPSTITLDAWTAASRMAPGINIGNTLENTASWETGWGNPVITREFVASLAKLGFKTVRVPVAWDTYAVDEKILPEKMARVAEVVDWILEEDMFAVVNIHWDGGWIDSGNQEKFPETYGTFSVDAERKFRSYWQQIATHFADRGEKLLFEGLNEETKFSGVGSKEKEYATLLRVNQLFVDTVRNTGGRNASRLLVVAGHHTDFEKTADDLFKLPKDSAQGRLFISVHYYTPWQFCGLAEDADWGKVKPTWGAPEDVKEQTRLFDLMAEFAKTHDVPVFVGEYNVTEKREPESRLLWLKGVTRAAMQRKMVPVLWDTGGEVSRAAPHDPSDVLAALLRELEAGPR